MEKHKMYKAAPASYHKHICVWFCNKKTSVSAAKLHLLHTKKHYCFRYLLSIYYFFYSYCVS